MPPSELILAFGRPSPGPPVLTLDQDGLTYQLLKPDNTCFEVAAKDHWEEYNVRGLRKLCYTFKNCKTDLPPHTINVSTTNYWEKFEQVPKQYEKPGVDPIQGARVVFFRLSERIPPAQKNFGALFEYGNDVEANRRPLLMWSVMLQKDAPEKTEVSREIGAYKELREPWNRKNQRKLELVLEGWRAPNADVDVRLKAAAVVYDKKTGNGIEDIEYGKEPFLCHHWIFEFNEDTPSEPQQQDPEHS